MTITETTRRSIIEAIESVGAPGCAMAWIDRHGASDTLVHGLADASLGRAVAPHTRFHLFSGTKLYTAAAVMRLMEAGKISLDAPVRTYLSDLTVRDELTVRHLLSHNSGLSDTLRAFLAAHFPDEPAPSAAAALQRYQLGRGEAGRGARYGNVNYAILGELISRVSGMPYVEFVRREIFEPLGAELSFDPTGESSAVGYVSRFSPMLFLLRILLPDIAKRIRAGRAGRLVALRPYAIDTAAIGGICGAAPAFLPFLREMLSDADGVLQATSKREMLKLQSQGAAGIVSRDGVGLGWKRGTMNGRVFWNHEGGGAGFGTETRLYPDVGLGIVILMNLSHSAGLSRACHRISELLREGHHP